MDLMLDRNRDVSSRIYINFHINSFAFLVAMYTILVVFHWYSPLPFLVLSTHEQQTNQPSTEQ